MSKISLPSSSLPVGELSRIIDDAALFADRGTNIPILNAVHLESTSERLIAVATDRFTLGSATAKYLEDAPGGTFTTSLKLAQAQILSRIAKSCKTAFSNVSVVARDGSVTFTFTTGESLTLPTVDYEANSVLNWRRIIEDRSGDKEGDAVAAIAFNPGYLAKFSKVTDASRIAIKFSGPKQGALVSITDQFIGVIMPVRLNEGDAWNVPEWLKRPEAPVAKPKVTATKRPPVTRAPARRTPVKKVS